MVCVGRVALWWRDGWGDGAARVGATARRIELATRSVVELGAKMGC
jgi:hypothetical protein